MTDTNLARTLGGVDELMFPGALTHQITSSGVMLDSAFIDKIRTAGKGIVLIEARTGTTRPLVMEVRFGSQIVAQCPLYLSITPVEQMFRHKNLMLNVSGTSLGAEADRLIAAAVTNEPDTDNKNFVFIHGYNVNPYRARGWQFEMFKRMYWSGSHAKFYGVTWDGAESQLKLGSLGQFTPDYHTNVVNAFLTAPALASFLDSLTNGPPAAVVCKLVWLVFKR